MKGCVCQLVLSASLAALVFSAPSSSKSLVTARNKRSFPFLDKPHEHAFNQNVRPVEEGLDTKDQSSLDMLDFDSILNDPFLMDFDLDEPLPNQKPGSLPPFAELMPPKDQMSNVIPGAHGPYDSPARPEQRIADNLMDDFMMFLTMKESGMLDMCLGFGRRRR